VLVANLPYSVATPLVLDLLRDVPAIGRMLVMVQREAGERLVAVPGARNFGAVSVRVDYFATAAIVGRVSPGVFLPRPNVESVLVDLVRRESPAIDPDVASYAEIDLLLRAGFGGRRKMLRRSLEGFVDETTFAAAGIDGRSRAEELGIEEWGKLVACRRSITFGLPPN
jgi:16S rRNA (adenine1518-N6/adenine1519-N6)-dimethyltransferase